MTMNARINKIEDMPDEEHWVLVINRHKSYMEQGYGDPGEDDYHHCSMDYLEHHVYTDVEELKDQLETMHEFEKKAKYKVFHVKPVNVKFNVSVDLN